MKNFVDESEKAEANSSVSSTKQLITLNRKSGSRHGPKLLSEQNNLPDGMVVSSSSAKDEILVHQCGKQRDRTLRKIPTSKKLLFQLISF